MYSSLHLHVRTLTSLAPFHYQDKKNLLALLRMFSLFSSPETKTPHFLAFKSYCQFRLWVCTQPPSTFSDYFEQAATMVTRIPLGRTRHAAVLTRYMAVLQGSKKRDNKHLNKYLKILKLFSCLIENHYN